MPRLNSHTADSCSYQLLRPTWIQRRHQLLIGAWLACSGFGFTWPGRVPHVTYQAAHGSVTERVEALRLLEEYPGQASRDACLAGLEDGASEVRAQAAQCVGIGADERAATNLLDLAEAKDPLERAAALEALGRIAPARALASIERAISDQQPLVRATAVSALRAYVRDGSFDVAKLDPVLRAELVAVRLAAITLLQEVPAAAAATRALQLRAAAKDPAAEVRVAALRAMGGTRDAKILPDLVAALSDADESVRLAAIAALGDSGLPGAVRPLRDTTSASAGPLRAARTALAALGRIDDPNALPPLASALIRPELVQSAALALVTRAQRINEAQTYQQSVSALQRAIESASPQTAPSTRSGNQAQQPGAATTTARSASAAAQGETPATAHTALSTRPGSPAEPQGAATSSAGSASAATSAVATKQAREELALDALASAVAELAAFTSVEDAVTSLVRALAAGRGDVRSLTQHVIAIQREHLNGAQLLAALLARDAAAAAGLPDAVLAVLLASSDAPALVAAHREQLQRVADERSSLHAILHVAEADASPDRRRALAALWVDQPALAAERANLDRLLRWLDDADADVREHSSVALGRAADVTALQALSTRLEKGAPHPELTLRACAGAILRAQKRSALYERLLQQFQAYLSQPDETVAMSAIFALRAANDQRSAPWIAGLLRGSSPQLRAAAIQSLAGFDQPEARRMLRDMLRGDNVQNASNAALALAELGTDRDVEALLRAAERSSWPLPPAAAYATARITARGVTRKHSLERVLCRFARLRDSAVLANIVSALATLGADACDAQMQPKPLLDSTQPSSVRAAAALWLQSMRPHSPEESAERNALLSRCVSDHDSTVAAACRPSGPRPAPLGHTLLRVLDPDAHSALTHRVIALRHPDGTVFVGQSDNTGHVYLPRAAPRELRLEDPADYGVLDASASP